MQTKVYTYTHAPVLGFLFNPLMLWWK